MNREKCKSCRYAYPVDLGDGGEMLRACVYILRRGSRRPCPAGEACTAFEPERGGKQERQSWAFSGSRA